LTTCDTVHEISSPQPTHWRFWGTLLWGTLIFAIFTVLQILTMIVVGISRKSHFTEAELRGLMNDGYFLSLTTFITTLACCGLVVGVVKLKKGSQLAEYLCIRKVSLKILLKWIGLLVCFLVLSDLITFFIGRPIVPPFMSAAFATAKPAWTIWIAMIIAAPLSEETFFRGFLFKGFESSFMKPIGAILLTALIWAAIHLQYDLYGMGTIFFTGLLFGAARLSSGSLLVPLCLHAFSNLVATIEAAILG
jgi:membrane protease YdiL (CAAX protease family)